MKHFPLLLFITSILCVATWLGCGVDDERGTLVEGNDATPTDDVSGERVDILGTWMLVSVEPQIAGVGDLPIQILTIEPDETWRSMTTIEVLALGTFTVTAKGTYKLSGNKIIGETAEIQSEPDFGIPFPAGTGMAGESTVTRDGNRLIITSTDEASGQTTIAIYEKQ